MAHDMRGASGGEDAMTNEIRLSELAVLDLIRTLGQPTLYELTDALEERLRGRKHLRPFGLGPFQSFQDFLAALDAAGSVVIERDGDRVVVAITPHGRHLLDKGPDDLRQHFGFA